MATRSRTVTNKELFITNGLMKIFMTSGLELPQPKRPPLSVCVTFALICPHILKIYTAYNTILLLLHLIFFLRDSLMKNKCKKYFLSWLPKEKKLTQSQFVYYQILFSQRPLKPLINFQIDTGTESSKSPVSTKIIIRQQPVLKERQLCFTSSYTERNGNQLVNQQPESIWSGSSPVPLRQPLSPICPASRSWQCYGPES